MHVAEALELRQAGLEEPILCLMAVPEHDHAAAIAAEVDLSAGSADLVRRLAAAAAVAGRPARVHLKADTGLSRGGAAPADWPAAARGRERGRGGGPGHRGRPLVAFRLGRRAGQPLDRGPADAFKEALAVAESTGITAAAAAHRQHRGRA